MKQNKTGEKKQIKNNQRARETNFFPIAKTVIKINILFYKIIQENN